LSSTSLYDNNTVIFVAVIAMLSFLAAIVPLMYAVLKRRRMSRPFEPSSLSLNYSSDRSIRPNSSFATETTHLLTLKEVYASTHNEGRENGKLRGRNIVIKSNSQDPFRLSDSVLGMENVLNSSATELAAAAAEAEAMERSQNLAAAAAEAADMESIHSDDDCSLGGEHKI
jgi:hypothetical protein